MTKYLAFFVLLCAFAVPSSAHATAYYIDFVNGRDTNTGLGTTSATAWQSLNQFANNARSPGDIAFVRRNQASTTNVTSVTFTSAGNRNNPIVMTADYDSLWPQDFADSAQTYTVTFGSVTMTASGSITGVAAGDWVYVSTECTERYAGLAGAPSNPTINNCEYAYEVRTVSGTTLTLWMPYRGNAAGSGLTLRVMQNNPVVGLTTTNTQITSGSNGDNYWILKGLEYRCTNAVGCIGAVSTNFNYIDNIVQTNGVSANGMTTLSGANYFKKFRVFDTDSQLLNASGTWTVDEMHGSCNNRASTSFLPPSTSASLSGWNMKNVIVEGCTNFVTNSGSNGQGGADTYFRNVTYNNVFNTISGRANFNFLFDDDFSTVGQSRVVNNMISAGSLSTTTAATSTNLRSGGGPTNLVVYPPSGTGNTGISTFYFPYSYMKLFEYPIYSDAASHTYTMYFNSTSTAQWTTNPLTQTATGSSTPELFIECEYYNESSGADRYTKRSNSASDVDFAGSTAWQDISVTCTPAQAGVLYLRGWYAKPKETGGNIFYMDTTPVIN